MFDSGNSFTAYTSVTLLNLLGILTGLTDSKINNLVRHISNNGVDYNMISSLYGVLSDFSGTIDDLLSDVSFNFSLIHYQSGNSTF